MVAYFCQPHIHLAMSKVFFKNATYSVIVRQVENFRVIHLGILNGQNCVLVHYCQTRIHLRSLDILHFSSYSVKLSE